MVAAMAGEGAGEQRIVRLVRGEAGRDHGECARMARARSRRWRRVSRGRFSAARAHAPASSPGAATMREACPKGFMHKFLTQSQTKYSS